MCDSISLPQGNRYHDNVHQCALLYSSYRMYADFDIREGKLESAYENATKALDIAMQSGSTTPWVAAALYYKGDVRLRQGKTKDAT